MSEREAPDPGMRPRVQAQTLSEWRIEQIEIRLDRELKDLRFHVDRSITEARKYIDDEIKEMREQNDKRFSKIEKFITATLVFISTPVVGAMIALVIKNPPNL